jgi:hypothetical protein
MVPQLPHGLYPFIDQRLPLTELTMGEAPPDLEALFKSQATANGTTIIRDRPVELTCRSAEYPEATFLIYWRVDRTEFICLCRSASRRAARSYHPRRNSAMRADRFLRSRVSHSQITRESQSAVRKADRFAMSRCLFRASFGSQ